MTEVIRGEKHPKRLWSFRVTAGSPVAGRPTGRDAGVNKDAVLPPSGEN